jgi:hypothetical protein
MDNPGPPVFIGNTPFYELPLFQAIDRSRSRATGKPNPNSQGIHRQRALVQKDLEDLEIREAHTRVGNALLCKLPQCPVSFHQNQPQVNAGTLLHNF